MDPAHGRVEAAVHREDGLLLARALRDVGAEGALPRADAGAAGPLPQQGARRVRRSGARRRPGPGDDALAGHAAQQRGRSQRELRPRDVRTLRARPRELLRAGRPAGGADVHRLAVDPGAGLPDRGAAARRRRQDRARTHRRSRRRGRHPARGRATGVAPLDREPDLEPLRQPTPPRPMPLSRACSRARHPGRCRTSSGPCCSHRR